MNKITHFYDWEAISGGGEVKKADRFNEGKLQWNLVDWESLKEFVKVLMFGSKKYAPDNWKKGLNREEILESMQRHLVALFNKEETDPESGLHHMGHIICNAVFYLFHFRNKSFTK